MSEILIHGDDLQQAAGKFISASGSVQATLKELDDTVTALEKKWSGSTQQVFYRKYRSTPGDGRNERIDEKHRPRNVHHGRPND